MKIVTITNAVHEIVELEWLKQSEAVHRQLRDRAGARNIHTSPNVPDGHPERGDGCRFEQ